VAGLTVRGRWFVEQDRLAFDQLFELVAIRAAHVAMHSLQGEMGASIVIKQRRFPARRAVTFTTWGYTAGFGELGTVVVGMATFTLLRSRAKVSMDQLGFQVGRLMAIDACHGAVGPGEREGRLLVIEPGQFIPRFGRVTRFAAGSMSVERAFHSFAKLPAMRVVVATGARQRVEVVASRSLNCTGTRSRCMTFHAGYRQMAAGKFKSGLLMARDIKR
jgi:hypothetical protein